MATRFTRRMMIAGAGAGAGSLFGSQLALADGICPNSTFYQPLGPAVCNAFVNPKGIQVAAQTNSEWCWAATTANLFAYYGHTVSQDAIVQAGVGRLANVPGSLQNINSILNRGWTDVAGRQFTSSARVLYSVDAVQSMPSNAEIINALQANHPLFSAICLMR
jgi:hypothetical protein